MMRNDYRRSLILLRSNASGYSGHVRLERRTLMGTMYFLVQSPGDCPALRAALVGRGRDGGYYACALGELQQDGRGQAVLGYSFDPRDICKRELEQYQMIAITCAGDASCQVALFGNVCGHAEFNWEGVRAALCALYEAENPPEPDAQTEPAAPPQSTPVTELPLEESPSNGEITPGSGNVTEFVTDVTKISPRDAQAGQDGATGMQGGVVEADVAAPEGAQTAGLSATRATTQSGAAQAIDQSGATHAAQFGTAQFAQVAAQSGAQATGQSGAAKATAQSGATHAAQFGTAQFAQVASPNGVQATAQSGAVQTTQSSAAQSAVQVASPSAAQTATSGAAQAGAQSDAAQPDAAQAAGEALACDLLEAQGVSASAPWPGAAEALRALFRTSPALTDAPDDQCVYVEAPMPEGSGFPFVAAGLLILGGALAAIRYALPATWSEEPPAGLEDCAWIGDQNTGWWLTEVPL